MITLEQLIPGGILETDHWHIGTYDETCSRCRQSIPDHQVPLSLYQGDNMLSYCEPCCGVPTVETENRRFCMFGDPV